MIKSDDKFSFNSKSSKILINFFFSSSGTICDCALNGDIFLILSLISFE